VRAELRIVECKTGGTYVSHWELKELNISYNTSQLILCLVTIAACSEMHTKHIKTLCGHNLEFLNAKLVLHIMTTWLYRVKSQL